MLAFIPLFLLALSELALTKTVTLNWSIDWVRAAPVGGLPEKSVIGVNGKWPCPQVDVGSGDRLVVNVFNNLGNQSTTIHWHGMYQNGTNQMDGAGSVTQCPIAPGRSYTYDFTVNKVGTYWYHSHAPGQYPDGLWGPLIVHDPNPPFKFDEEFTFALSDWYNEPSAELVHKYQSPEGEAFDGVPTPSGGAVYGYWGKFTAIGKNISVPVEPNKTYLVHIICAAAYPGIAWVVTGHNQTAVEVDGVYVQPVNVNQKGLKVRLAPGQRQSVLITTKSDTSKNYALWSILDLNILFANKKADTKSPEVLNYNANVTSWLVYNKSAPLPDPPVYPSIENKDFWDDLDFVPLDGMPLLEPVNHRIVLNVTAANISHISRFEVNKVTYLEPEVPSLYTALSVGDEYVGNPQVYGPANPIVIKHNDIVEIIMNNQHTNLHPWHLHGHQFQVLDRPDPFGGNFNGTWSRTVSRIPLRRDTVMLQDVSYAVIRFRADNPGVWLFHCHSELHVASGLTITMIEAPNLIAKHNGPISQADKDLCKAFPMPYSGNAVGNTGNVLSLNGTSFKVPQVNWGSMYPPGTPPHNPKVAASKGGK
jgi:iron transport multicopper oxidase